MNKFIILFTLYLSSTFLHAQIPYAAIYDADQSQHFGAENMITAHHLLYTGFDKIIPAKLGEENTFLKKAGGIAYRALKLGLLDFQMDFLAALTQHEVYGHGSRMRELGYVDIKYRLSPFIPYGSAGGSASGRLPAGNILAKSQHLAVSFSGNEGNLVLSDQLESRILLNNRIHYRQALLFLIGRNNLLQYTSRTHLFDGDGDISSYISRLDSSGEGGYDSKKIFLQNLTVLANPLQWYATFAIGKNYLLDGENTKSDLPAIRIKDIRYYPSLNFNLTPFGGEFIFNQYFIKNNKLLLLQARLGDDTFHSFYGGGLRMMNVVDQPKLRANVEFNLWHQPEFQLGGTSRKTIQAGPGFMTNISFSSSFPFNQAPDIGVYAKVGYKSAGYIMGEILDKGLILRLGLALDLEP